ncbi:hypothetical protein HPB50_024072 [Hyalomma asiaticum]|uniref:Uncharacterized protein n=1 Tax=Hyalomma asiaticum TaxID=266040 RepID=A0ACB7SW78_HYAAI|nr:hypothetical protein HPB50_024072 [Hyalomma asiaticum]
MALAEAFLLDGGGSSVRPRFKAGKAQRKRRRHEWELQLSPRPTYPFSKHPTSEKSGRAQSLRYAQEACTAKPFLPQKKPKADCFRSCMHPTSQQPCPGPRRVDVTRARRLAVPNAGFVRSNEPTMYCLLYLVATAAVIATAVDPDPEDRFKLARANNYLGLNLLKALPSNANTNVFFSPFSVATAIGMAYIGARGDTLEQLTLNFGYSADELNEQKVLALFKEQLEAARDLPHEYTLDIANAAVAQEGYGVLPNFTEALMSSFGAEYLQADFSKKGQEAIDKINKWVSEKTHGKVRSLFEEPPDFSTRLILLNAVYYKGTWLYEFNKARTKPRSFYNGGVTKVLVPMMKMKSTLNHTFDATLNADVVDLPYVGNDIAMTILLPSERNGIEHLKSALTIQNLEKAIARMYPKDMKLKFPKFKMDTKYTLKPTLESLGIRKIFSADADLSGISGAKNLYVSDVLHKAVLEVNEEGSEAAAVTGFVIQLRTAAFVTPPPLPKVYVDHPFIFLIRNVHTNTMMFLGEVNAL